MEEKADLKWLSDPEVFAVGRLPAHSDHYYYNKDGDELKLSLNGSWDFYYAKNPHLRQADFWKEDFDTSGADRINVPGHIQLQGYDQIAYVNKMYPWDGYEDMRPPQVSEEYNPVASYIRFFDLPEGFSGKQVCISFQGVECAMYLWLNGRFIGYAEDGFTPSEFDLTDVVRKENNRLCVEVYKRSSASWIEDQDMWRFSGIFRDVYLYAVERLHAADLKVKAVLDKDYSTGLFSISAKLSGEVGDIAGCHADIKLFDANDQIVWQEKNVAISDNTILAEARLGDVHPWSGEEPYLYRAEVLFYDGDNELAEKAVTRCGFRTFEMKDGLMLLNGRRIIFRGVNRHEFSCDRGRAITYEDMLKDICILKRNNINAVRTSHYPDNSLWYELCDEYGIYLIDETNLEAHGSWDKMGVTEASWNVPGSDDRWKEAVLDRAKSMYERDKNHPSVLIFSCGNEAFAGTNIMAMADYFREADDSRLVHYEGVFWTRDTRWYDPDFERISDMESRMYAKPAEIEEYLSESPGKPYISCEYMHAMGNSCGGLSLYTDLEDKYEKYQGGFIWDYLDQAIRYRDDRGREVFGYGGDFDDRGCDYEFCGDGIVFADRSITPKMQEVKQLYAPVLLAPGDGSLTIRNRNQFVTTERYDFVLSVLVNGKTAARDVIKAAVKPLSSAVIDADIFKDPLRYTDDDNAEIIFDAKAVMAFPVEWSLGEGVLDDDAVVPKGHVVSQGQFIARAGNPKGAFENRTVTALAKKSFKVIEGDYNVGVHGDGFSVLFAKGVGLVSLNYDGTEYTTRAPWPTYFRAATDNDRGAGYGYDRGQYLTATLYSVITDTSVETEADKATVKFTYSLPGIEDSRTELFYTVHQDGAIEVRLCWKGVAKAVGFPAFGWEFKTKGRLDRFEYYGNGPMENYSDRSFGAFAGIYSGAVKDNFTPYLVPQECGNRTGIRELTIKDGRGSGLKITSLSEDGFEGSVLPYSAYELENAMHSYELCDTGYTWVRVLAKQMGVGGDDTWGAPVHDEYLLSAEEDMELAFVINKIKEEGR